MKMDHNSNEFNYFNNEKINILIKKYNHNYSLKKSVKIFNLIKENIGNKLDLSAI